MLKVHTVTGTKVLLWFRKVKFQTKLFKFRSMQPSWALTLGSFCIKALKPNIKISLKTEGKLLNSKELKCQTLWS